MNTFVKEFENQYLKMRISDTNILYAEYKQGVSLDYDIVKELIEDRIKFQENKSYVAIIDVAGINYISPEAKKLIDKNGSLMLLKCAMVVNQNKFMRMVISTLFLISPPSIPVKLFGSLEKAELWVNE